MKKHVCGTPRKTLLAAALLAALNQASAQQTAEAPAAKAADDTVPSVVVLGSRGSAKSALDTAVPVGLIGAKDLQNAGPVEVGKLLQTLDPSFNFSSTFISDGT